MYFDEDIVLDVRLNFLDKFVDKFVIIESEYNHKGEKRTPLFDINNFKKFKNKIKYILINDIPPGIEIINTTDNKKEIYRKSIFNAWKRENLQRNQIQKGLLEVNNEDWIIISAKRFVAPITLVGLTALSVLTNTNFSTSYFTDSSDRFIVPNILVLIASHGKFSCIGTCLYAAA